MNRLGLGLAVGAGYVLGRTKKMKLAFAVGTMVAGKRMQLSPKALADLVSGQLANNPAFKELNDQLRNDLRGVGKAASGALVERQIEGLAKRLHGRTADVRNQLSGVSPDAAGHDEDEDDEPDDRYEDEPEEQDDDRDETPGRESAEEERPRKKAPAKKAPAKTAQKQGAAKKAPARKTAAGDRKTSAGKTAAKKTAARRVPRSRQSEGGRDDG
ncbi:DNA primase [Streptomyces sp. NPDC005551]|uniref:DNA primase n=1 Tax=unclassified Streptomyces TaxID=2593676 RepID=UPI0033CE6A26